MVIGRVSVAVVVPSVETRTVDAPSAVVTASAGTSTTSVRCWVVIVPVTAVPARNVPDVSSNVTVTAKEATPDEASATSLTAATVPVAVAAALALAVAPGWRAVPPLPFAGAGGRPAGAREGAAAGEGPATRERPAARERAGRAAGAGDGQGDLLAGGDGADVGAVDGEVHRPVAGRDHDDLGGRGATRAAGPAAARELAATADVG